MLLHGIIMDVTQQKLDRVEVERSQRELRRLAAHLQVVRDEERASIAWELHDKISQALSAVKMDVARFSGNASVDEDTGLQQTVTLLDETIARLRRLYSGLRPGMLEDLGLSATIEWRTSEFSRESGIATRVTHLDDIGVSENGSLVALYRVFDEILQLDVRDSGATEVAVEVRYEDGRAVVRVMDNRPVIPGKPVDHRASLLHAAMRERLRDHEGDIHANRDRNDWYVSEISLPLVQPPARG